MSFRIKKITPQLLVSDLERALGFYTKQLDFEIDFRYEDFYSGLSKDGSSINLKSGSPSIENRTSRRVNEDPDLIVSVSSIDEVYESFAGKSVDIIQSLRTMPYGKEFYIADPDGNVIAFIE